MLQAFLDIGIDDTLDMYQKRKVRYLNFFSLIIIGIVHFSIFDLLFLSGTYPLVVEFFLGTISFGVIFLNLKKKYAASIYLFVTGTNLGLLLINLYFDSSSGSYLYYFPILFFTALLHNPTRKFKRSIILFSMITSSVLLSYLLDNVLITKVYTVPEQNHQMFVYNVLFSSVLTFFVVVLVVRQMNTQHKEFTSLLEQINSDRITIKNSLEEKEVLLSEVQHRVKNNLSVIIGLFNLQLDKSENEDYKELLNEAKNRVLSIAMVHQKIFKKSDLSKINLSTYISDLVQEIVKSHTLKDSVHVYEDLSNIEASVTTAVPVGLIVNEVITNSLKHAFDKHKQNCILRISLKAIPDNLVLKIQDNGVGFPNIIEEQNKSIGLILIQSLSEQLDADINFRNEDGAVVELKIPII